MGFITFSELMNYVLIGDERYNIYVNDKEVSSGWFNDYIKYKYQKYKVDCITYNLTQERWEIYLLFSNEQ